MNDFMMDICNHLYEFWVKEEVLKQYYLLHKIIAGLLDKNLDYQKQ